MTPKHSLPDAQRTSILMRMEKFHAEWERRRST